jgi:hypothetical protein
MPLRTAKLTDEEVLLLRARKARGERINVKEEADKFSVKQTDPDKGLTMLGTAVRSVNGYKLEFEVLPAPGLIQSLSPGRVPAGAAPSPEVP